MSKSEVHYKNYIHFMFFEMILFILSDWYANQYNEPVGIIDLFDHLSCSPRLEYLDFNHCKCYLTNEIHVQLRLYF